MADGDQQRGLGCGQLFACVAICCAVVVMVLPSLQAARESSRRMTCQNHLKQMSHGIDVHESVTQFFPHGGERSSCLDSDVDGPRRVAPPDELGWAYQILPYLEEKAVWENADAMSGSLIAIYACPTRRGPTLLPSRDGDGRRGSLDYAGSAGTDDGSMAFDSRRLPPCSDCPAWGMPGNGRDAAIIRRSDGSDDRSSPVSSSTIPDGLSETLLLGEKCLNRALLSANQAGDCAGWADGWGWDIVRWCHVQPQPDFRNPSPSTAHADYLIERSAFGSSHPGSFHAAFCDGTVRPIAYEIDARVFQRLGSRDDGTQ